MKKSLLISILTLFACAVKAQDRDSVNVLSTQEIIVYGQHNSSNSSNIGSRSTSINKAILESNKTKSLSELLSENSVVHIKSYGQGSLATSSFRGTSSSHTQVNWNGLNINPSMTGSFDFSQLPVFFTDEVSLYHGGSYVKNGTGALGGSINIGNNPNWDDTTRLNAFFEGGSFNTYTGAASLRYFGKNSVYRTRIYYQSSENDFRYLNKVLLKDPFYDHRKNAEYKQSAFMQEGYWKMPKGAVISSNLWLQYNDRNIPQPVIVNKTQDENQQNTSLKYYIGYEKEAGKNRYTIKGGYMMDFMYYTYKFANGEGRNNRNLSNTVVIQGDYTHTFSQKININSSAVYSHDMVNATSYSSRRINRDIFSAQVNSIWDLSRRVAFNAQIMTEINDGTAAPTFSLGATVPLIENVLAGKISTAYNYHFPTLNDLYWQPGGNLELVPEKGFSHDVTLAFTPQINGAYIKIEATGYLMNIKDWIVWMPSDSYFWSPRNIQKVRSYGMELSINSSFKIGDVQNRVNANYAYSPTKSVARKSDSDESYGCQLPYVPKNKANARYSIEYKGAFLTYNVSYTGIRYTTTDNSYSTNAYTIHDAEIGYSFALKNRYRLTPKFKVNNMFNTYYESIQYYPMPLRSLMGSITLSF